MGAPRLRGHEAWQMAMQWDRVGRLSGLYLAFQAAVPEHAHDLPVLLPILLVHQLSLLLLVLVLSALPILSSFSLVLRHAAARSARRRGRQNGKTRAVKTRPRSDGLFTKDGASVFVSLSRSRPVGLSVGRVRDSCPTPRR